MICKHCESRTSFPCVMIVIPMSLDLEFTQMDNVWNDSNFFGYLNGVQLSMKCSYPDQDQIIAFHPKCFREIAGMRYMPPGIYTE